MASETPFDPTRYLTRVNGSEYLEVKWRLVWLRDRHPDATVETELVSHHDNTAPMMSGTRLSSRSRTSVRPSDSPAQNCSLVGRTRRGLMA